MDAKLRAAAIRRFGDGVFLPTSNAGLAALERRFPDTWHRVVQRYTPATRFRPGTTLRTALRSRLNLSAMPGDHRDRKRIERPRRLGAHADRVAGGVLLARIDEERLQELVDELVADGVYAEPAARAASLVRRLALAWASELGVEPRVADHPQRSGPRRGHRRRRKVTQPSEAAVLLANSDPETARFIALVAGGGLREQEALQLKTGDLRPGRQVRVRASTRSGCERDVVLAAWAAETLAALGPPIGNDAGFIFGHRLDPTRPRLTFGPRLRQLLPDAAATSESLRRLCQATQRAAGLPRELVRGSWDPAWSVGAPPWWQAYVAHQASWRVLVHPPVHPGQSLRVPRRSQGTHPLEPDRGALKIADRLLLPACVAADASPPPIPAPAPARQIGRSATVVDWPERRGERTTQPRHEAQAPQTASPAGTGPASARGQRQQDVAIGRSLDKSLRDGQDDLDRRLQSLERATRAGAGERNQILGELRRLDRPRPVSRPAGGAGPFLAGAAAGGLLTLLAHRPELLERLDLDPATVANIAAELEAGQEPLGSLQDAMKYAFAGPAE